ncbi:MAG: RluA family pseudouridine synthase [Bauldia sp.]|nr:RluA family pseudouridine synthase [Bauldia sp.]
MPARTAAMPRPRVRPPISISRRSRVWTASRVGSSGASSSSSKGELRMSGPDRAAEVREVAVTETAAGSRLDAFLATAIDGLSRSRAKALILGGHVTVGGATVVEPKHPVNAGEAVAVGIPEAEPAVPEAEAIPLSVVYEDADVIVIDKPAGLVVHPGAGNWTGTLVNALIAHCGDSLSGIGGVRRPGIVHRLDKDTSGLLVVAKTDRAHAGLAAQFADHGRTGPLVRGYRALAWGAPSRKWGTIEAAIARSTRNRQRMAVAKEGGREAVTHYEIEETFGPAAEPLVSLLSLGLETGRTHQIRVHLASIGNPVIGDPDYGAGFATRAARLREPARGLVQTLGRQALHAWLLGFSHPVTRKKLRFESPLPADMASILAALRTP